MILDIILIVILIAFAFIGYKIGLIPTLLKLASGISGLFVALVFTRTTADTAINMGLADGLENTILDNVVNNSAYQTYLEGGKGEAGLNFLLNELGIPSFVSKLISSSLASSFDPENVANVISSAITYAIVLVISFILLLLLSTLIFWLVKKFFKGLRKITVIRVCDGILGIVFYIFIYIVIMYVLLFILQLVLQALPPDNSFSEFIFSQLHLEDDVFGLAKHLYENNIIENIFGLIF